MINLNPGETFIIARQIDDPVDTDTYYVQAKIRNAKTDALLATVNLTDKGNQRFRGEWAVPQDPTGLGFYITITTRVYTDSGYTTESPNKAIEEKEYLVQDRKNPYLGGGGAGVDVDYKKIDKIIRKRIKEIAFPKSEKVDLEKVIREVKRTGKDLKRKIDKQKTPETDLTPLLKAIQNIPEAPDYSSLLKKILSAVENLPEPEKPDYTPVLEAVKGIDFSSITDLVETLKGNQEKANKVLFAILQEVKKKLSELQERFDEGLTLKVNSEGVTVSGKKQPKKRAFL